ncbi:uncharacterized protein LOC141649504 [Silene latifolia]|uniref:uncharacterized protein LOC141649504 n=1 Tax=Silene latifolia TaxID=37657 RepID=UPI003D773867
MGEGGCYGGASIARTECWEPLIAEALAVLDGLQEARNRGDRNVMVESDCLQLVDALKEKRKGRSMFSQIIDDILVICNDFQSVLWSHTSRINNCVPHSLAHIMPRVVGRMVWVDVLPRIANNAVMFDISLLI